MLRDRFDGRNAKILECYFDEGACIPRPLSGVEEREERLSQSTPRGLRAALLQAGRVPDEAELIGLVPGCVGWLAGVERITDAALARATGLRAISCNGTGVDSIDLAACKRRGVAVLREEGVNARGVAELTIALLLSLFRSVPFSDARMKVGAWERRQGVEAEGKTLEVIGTGRIGRLVRRFAFAMDMKVLGYDAFPDTGWVPSPSFRYAELPARLQSADVVTLHCPHAAEEKPPIDGRALAQAEVFHREIPSGGAAGRWPDASQSP